MKIVCIGGGPAGLYFGLLMKQLNPAHDVTVVERNKAYDTFGWGVVFSDATMDNMRQWDRESADEIEQAFNHWDDIELLFKGRRIRSGGHGFVGIGRKKLLNILQARCERLGVKLEFECEATSDLDYADADLIIASDGINSTVRSRYTEVFRPDIVTRPNRYIWLGTDRLYDAFTFDFQKTEHGWFQAHIYKFDDKTTTFIVECPEHVWLAHGLDKADPEQSIAFCEKLFAETLQGAKLMTNARHLRGSAWLNFQRVVCEQWWLKNQRPPRGADGRRGAHGALRHRLGHQARAGRRHRVDAPVPATGRCAGAHCRGAGQLPGTAPRGDASPAERGLERDGVVRGLRRALLRPTGTRAVHVLDAHAQPAHQPREPAPARRGLAGGLRALVRRAAGAPDACRPAGTAADVHAVQAALGDS